MATAYLVESIPTGLESFRRPDSQYTEFVLPRLVDAATRTIDLSAMYWNLLAVEVPKLDETGFSAERLNELGAEHGKRLYTALENAARRGVQIRIFNSPGFGDAPESDRLKADFPDQVQVREIRMGDWYGAGIMHHKIWIFDGHSFYLGSANMDWNSLMQVKEIGIVVEDSPELAADMLRFYETWWQFQALPHDTRTVYDSAAQVMRQVPAWSALVPAADRIANPLDTPALQPLSRADQPLHLTLNGTPADVLISNSPAEVAAPGRADDLHTVLNTIHGAQESICLSFMDYTPLGYRRGNFDYDAATNRILIDGKVASPVWWPDLNNALIQAAITRGVNIRLLVSRWAYTSPFTAPFLRSLRDTIHAAHADPRMTAGQIDIRWFIIPGWDSVQGEGRKYPGHSRVNHTKYIVTDQRMHISTSNVSWDYFNTVSGASFNTAHAELRDQLQAVFDRDWNSIYTHVLV